jgi:hypothetical protein
VTVADAHQPVVQMVLIGRGYAPSASGAAHDREECVEQRDTKDDEGE